MTRIRPFLLPLLILTAMLCATYLVWNHERQNTSSQIRSQFDFLHRETVSRVEQRMASYEQMLRGVQGLFATTEVMERDKFRDYISSLQLDANFSGIQAIGVIAWVPELQKNTHVAAMQRLGASNYAIRPAGQREAYTPIVKLEPYIGSNLALFGLDQWPDPVRRLAMEKARDSGMPVISGMLRFVVDKKADAQTGFIMYLPIYAKGRHHDSVATRRVHLTGWVFAVIQMHDLMASLYGEQPPGLALAIYDGVEPSSSTLLYSSVEGGITNQPSAITANEYLVVAGRSWMLSLSTLDGFDDRFGHNAKSLIVITGISLSCVLALLAWLLASGRVRAIRLATTMTSELHKKIEEYEVVQALMLKAEEALVESNRKLESLSATDGLTGIANRRRFDEVLAKEYSRHTRSGAELSLILLDIDYFKAFNDCYGHVSGDQCLRQIAQVIADCATRDPDLAARYGGEEFACILPETDLNGAVAIAEKIRRGIITCAIPHSGSIVADYVTASLGVVTVRCTAEKSSLAILSQVDELLYRAKSLGRNRVECQSP
ncbi:MAG: CHASE domain-containing protein [Desulfuromonadales bacterium]